MAKKSVTDKEYRRMLAARQGRKGGQFGPLKPEYKTPKPPSAPTANTPPTDEAVAQQIGFLQALIRQRKSMGMETSELENYVIGTADKQGVRSVVEKFISENRQKFDQDDPAGAAAYQLMKEAVVLSEGSLKASTEDAKLIYARLKFIRELAQKTEGKQSAIAAKLDEIIKPVEVQLKKRTSFGEFLKEKAQAFKKTLPERMAAKVPVIGGLLSGFLKERRETQEDIEKYSGSLQEQISRRGRKTSELDIDEMGGDGGRGGMAARLGGTRASDIPGLDLGGAGKGIPSTLGAIYKEITQIRGLLESQFKPGTEELTNRESELEGLSKAVGKAPTNAGEAKKGGMLSNLLRMFMGGKEGDGGGTLSTLIKKTESIGTPLLAGAGKVGKFARGLGGTAMKFIRGTGAYKTLADAGKSVMGIGTKIAQSGVGKAVGSAASTVGGFFSGLAGKAGGMLGKLNPLSLLKGSIKSGAGKIIKGITSIPGLGAIIEAIIGAMDIADIKSNSELSPDEKKEKIGIKLVSTIGAALGSVGGGALGTFIPIPGIGTIVGSLGGSWVGGKLAELLAEQIGGRGIYDMAASIPGLGSLIEVGGAEDQKTKTEAEGQVKQVEKSASAATATGQGGESSTTTVEGKISAPATANTSVGRMANQYAAEKNALDEASTNTGHQFGKGPTTNTSNIQTRINTTNNHFNDDLRIRNNEPTQKQMQTFSLVP